jgi:hypothetical protein
MGPDFEAADLRDAGDEEAQPGGGSAEVDNPDL